MSLDSLELLSEEDRQSYADRLARELMWPVRPFRVHGDKFICTPSSDNEVAWRELKYFGKVTPIRFDTERARARAAEAM